ncbi:hypothetical protein FB45DRAFT_1035582 [Roridomyces roridus]|uniref:Uncharacterized protein n=1 Tax=Roridomyces roridus TaxID=1738132 RepID=A0AAD7FE32_9AGAR|nr:hypothetical protein FB45DRAFT_1035582 [Roridomyces roridus]
MTTSTPHRPGPLDGPFAQTARALLIIGACLNFLLFCDYCYLRWHPTSRPHRVSLRLLVYSQVANVIFCVSLAVGVNLRAGSTPWCSVINTLVYVPHIPVFSRDLLVHGVFVHRVNGQMMEKYYVLGSSILAMVCNITPLTAGQFGWNEVSHSCWFSDPDPAVGMRWLIGTQSCWVLSTALGEVVVFLVIIGDHAEKSGSSTHSTPGDWIMPTETPIGQYRNVIIRISLYPLVSCLTNFSTRLLDLWQAKIQARDPVFTEAVWDECGRRGDICAKGLRPVLYFSLAASDPALVRGIEALRRAGLERTTRERCESAKLWVGGFGGGFKTPLPQGGDPGEGPSPPPMLPRRGGVLSRGASIEVVDVGSDI